MSIINKLSSIFKEKSNSSIIREPIKIKSDLEKIGVKGKVKIIRDIPYEIIPKNGSLLKGNRIEMTHQYDCFYYLYNEQGNKLERRQPNEEYDTVSSNKYWGLKYLYDRNYILTEEHFYDYDDQISDFYTQSKSIYHYNYIGQIITIKVYDYDNKFVYDVHFTYDNKGNKIETRTIPDKNARCIKDKVKFYYDQFNNIIKKEDYLHYESVEETTLYNYDSKNNLIHKIIFDRKNEKIEEVTYITNQYGDVIEEKSNSKTTVINEYEYDKFGNWISKETCWIGHTIIENNYMEYEEHQWLSNSGSLIMGDRVLIERKIIYY